MDIRTLRERFHDGYYTCSINIPQRLPENYVFDEELSVRRNREMVIEHNQMVETLKKERIQTQEDLDKQFAKDVVTYLMSNYLLNEKQANTVERYAYENYHSCIYDYLANIDDVALFAERLIKEMES